MSDKWYDPSGYIKGLQQLLVSDKKRIGFLFGAGTSLAKKNKNSKFVPAITEMTKNINKKLSKNESYKKAIDEIESETGEKDNIESFLSNIESKISIIGDGNLNGLNKEEFGKMIVSTKKEIVEIVSIHKEILKGKNIDDLIHVDFAEWIGRANRKYPIEIFTTNYDFMFEIGLEKKSIPYYDGFTGSFEPFFDSASIEKMDFLPNQTKLWKLHGSLGWKINEDKVLRKEPTPEDILIYPSTLKYNNSRKQPYIALMDRLSNYIKQQDTILIISGYSFGDEHINDRILTALKANTLAHIYVLYYDKIDGKEDKKRSYSLTKDCEISKLAKENPKISVFGCRNAVIGSHYGTWKLRKEPDKDDTININLYFDEDGPVDESDKVKVEKKDGQKWTGEGELTLVDFKAFTFFLKDMTVGLRGADND